MNRREDKSINYNEPDKEFKKTKKKNFLPLIPSSPKCAKKQTHRHYIIPT